MPVKVLNHYSTIFAIHLSLRYLFTYLENLFCKHTTFRFVNNFVLWASKFFIEKGGNVRSQYDLCESHYISCKSPNVIYRFVLVDLYWLVQYKSSLGFHYENLRSWTSDSFPDLSYYMVAGSQWPSTSNILMKGIISVPSKQFKFKRSYLVSVTLRLRDTLS